MHAAAKAKALEENRVFLFIVSFSAAEAEQA
jgi:hypothetical protein